MAAIALASVTLNAVNPMTEFLKERDGSLEVRNYLDGYLMEKVRKEGGVSDDAVRRMFDMVAKAASDGADAILITCTIFSPYAEHFSRVLSKPVISPDQAMLDLVARAGGRTAILCTFTGTLEITRRMYEGRCALAGVPGDADLYLVDHALERVDAGDWDGFYSLIRRKAEELDQDYDNIVLAQISMAGAAKGLKLEHARLFTSPETAYGTVMAGLKQRAEAGR